MQRPMNLILFLCFIVALITAFVFLNSAMDYESSHNASGNVTNIITANKQSNNRVIELIIRKMAHMIEYAFLGIAVISLNFCLKKQYGKSFYGFALFYALAVAVTDEHIQSYSDRTSSTEDIIIDFVGALLGFFLVHLVVSVARKLGKRRPTAIN